MFDKQSLDDLVKLAFFSNMAQDIVSAITIEETLQKVMKHIGSIFAPSYWSLLLKNPRTGDLKFNIVIGSGVENLKDRVMPKGKGIAGWIAEHGEPVIISDAQKDERFDNSMDEENQFFTESIIGVPLKSKDQVFGVIELINKMEGGKFSAMELKLLSTIADFAAIAIEKAYYFKALKKVASVDSLTGLLNRGAFQRHLDKQIEQTKRNGEVFTVLLIDVNSFKAINDNYGHTVGDSVLTTTANILQKVCRKADIIGRYGGDEFVVLLPKTGQNEAAKLVGRIEEEVSLYNEDSSVKFSLSIGAQEAAKDNPEDIINQADREMYSQKQQQFERDIENLNNHLDDFLENS